MAQNLENVKAENPAALPPLPQTPPKLKNGAADLFSEMTISVDLDGKTLTDEQFIEIEKANPEWKIELNGRGELIFMPSTGLISGDKNSELNFQIKAWARKDGSGVVYDSSTAFTLPNGAKRSPDVAWILRDRLKQFSRRELEGFAKIAPDFVIELRSSSDSLKVLQEKMDEYIANGVRLGWLIDPKTRKAHIYRQGSAVEILEKPPTLDGENVLVNFTLDLSEIF